ncbi:MAG: hypothetical protein A3J48_03315 [Candidatus Doudnabacteria bacterium RIFCSPHIGHO2_02_FULL_46_11]|uniref:Endolytic murein transglycosylase n=1 Tax=Candidatus Doudnabacteria bacterium RIFCSPHIGHO2_02_FULL_46_11 TaxID=1817832 RepID=A0A1F5P853_9BACT|nr:MAG: hypothetical protein A3J48_03315 [Candidatus Doudnabacteria bacterium RIFCSPHIGHO2_02_FULL_46_11]
MQGQNLKYMLIFKHWLNIYYFFNSIIMDHEPSLLSQRPKLRIFLLLILLGLTIILSLGTYAAAKLKVPLDQDGALRIVTINQGTTARQVSGILERAGIISEDRLFLYYLWIKGAREKIQAGNYELSAAMTIPEVVQKITVGEVVTNEIRIRIGEGWRLSQIADELEKSGVGTADDFFKLAGSTPATGGRFASREITNRYSFLNNLPPSASLEGFLFPDTYIITHEGGAAELIHKALQNFENKVSSDILEQAKIQNRSLYEIITMASLVEAEVGRNVVGRGLTETEIFEIKEERKTVADVFWSRLDLGMALESDASISYATGKALTRATFEDLEVNSSYNTYRNPGLPKGPIGGPSLESIVATLNPANTEFLFFVTDLSGKAYFAETLVGHNRNRANHLD